ncbi:BTB and MATH domain-containing protein 36-like [Saccostrea cucullata]|uniref:BTB and MATH domain-containing protein 36-like n=1 Tax=Saccostrea cuccullata TaxID=36930 RepID=UPI002ED6B1EE
MADKAEEIKCSSELQYFREDSGVTDVILMVEDKEIHVTKVILMRSSPVFRAMFTDDFKEKSESRITFPGKSYEDFVLFLRSFYPGEHLELNVSVIERILPLAREYGMDALMKNFHERLLVDAESQTKDVFFHLKCFYIAAVYHFDELYNRMLENLKSVAVNTYKNRESFKMLPPEDKAQLYEKRCEFVEKHNSNLLNKMSRIKENLDSFEIWCEKCGKCMYISRKDKIWIWG